MKQIEVQIMGQSYLLGCPEDGEAQLREAVERVDAAMCKIRDAGKVKARDRIAVLASLNLAFDLVQREAAPAAAPLPAPSDERAQHATSDAAPDDVRAAQLVQRLDQALAGDGLLL
ncbi:MAG: cell division protein ZapA [Variovorax paradoxus]|uniref:Cell division protein ZapA n=1 Tax=Variovorax paradoxus TaxID=34073 RepID=A0A2W5R8P7_VARPD|nr:MAG: cell division protein ZapA [Variovorax paradoxus]